MQGRWLMRDALVQEIIAACQRAVSARELSIAYYHQLAHQPISFNEFARYNARGCARDCRRSNLMRVLGGHLMTALPRALIAVVISLGLAAAPGALGQDRV